MSCHGRCITVDYLLSLIIIIVRLSTFEFGVVGRTPIVSVHFTGPPGHMCSVGVGGSEFTNGDPYFWS